MHPWSMWVNCKITNISNDLVTVKSKKAHYYIFETVQTQYYNKNGKLTSYTCTARVNKHDIIESIISQLQILSEQYLFHRFFIVNDTCYWKKFLHKTEYRTLWPDYSQNIAFNEKKQVQSAHFLAVSIPYIIL